jgi:hypothetical protein
MPINLALAVEVAFSEAISSSVATTPVPAIVNATVPLGSPTGVIAFAEGKDRKEIQVASNDVTVTFTIEALMIHILSFDNRNNLPHPLPSETRALVYQAYLEYIPNLIPVIHLK